MTSIAVPKTSPRAFTKQSCASKPEVNLAARTGDDGANLIYFFHVPKTGGRTIIKHLEQKFATKGVVNPRKYKSAVSDILLRKKFLAPREFGDRPLVGHFASLSLIRGRENNYYKVCFWRHPAKWYLSFYNYRHHRNAHRIKRPFGFADFYRSMLRNPMTEALLLNCADVPGWSYFFMSDKQKFDVACATIERFDRFEDISKVDDFLQFIGYENGHKPKDYNQSSETKRVMQRLNQATVKQIEDQNRVDYLLHRIALGESVRSVREDAERVLSHAFDPRDLMRVILLPYYRYKVWFIPFI